MAGMHHMTPITIPALENTFTVPDGEMSTYFPSTLDDLHRHEQYKEAIRRCVDAFRGANDDRTPLLLDVGCGTGLLSLFALAAGARVLAVDANPLQVEATKQTLATLDVSADMWTVVPLSEVGPHLKGGVDIMVSELLGTLVNGEDMLRILKLYEPYLNANRGGPYVVPRRAAQAGLTPHASPSSL